MIFLSLIAVGALVGLLWERFWGSGSPSLDAAHRGMAGSFLAGGFAAGIAGQPIGPLDPIVLAVGAVGAVCFVILLRAVERPRRRPRRRPRARSAPLEAPPRMLRAGGRARPIPSRPRVSRWG